MSDEFLLIVPGSVHDARCDRCRQPIVWATVARRGRLKAMTRAFNATVRTLQAECITNDATGVTFLRWPADELHFTTCTVKQKPDPTHRRLVQTARDGQGRIF